MAYYPLFLDLTKKSSAVIGGGKVAERKVRGLLLAGAQVTVISPRLTNALKELAVDGQITHLACRFKAGLLDGYFLVISASPSKEVNREVTREAHKAGAIVNVVDDPHSVILSYLPSSRGGP